MDRVAGRRFGLGSCSRFLKSALVVTAVAFIALSGTCRAQFVKAVTSFTGVGVSANPEYVTLAQGRDGRLYGATIGVSGSDGAIFQLSTAGALAFPHDFDSTNGAEPWGGLTLSTDGNFYGVTTYGGSANLGVLYRLTPTGIYTVLYEFLGGADGSYPLYPPIEAADGNLYGTTEGQQPTSSPTATLYEYTSSGSFKTLYTFDQAHGQSPTSLIQAADGNLYGTTGQDGTNGCGTIFELTTSGVPIWSFSFDCHGGGSVGVQILQATDGNFYGVTDEGGIGVGYGTIFKLTPDHIFSTMYRFPQMIRDGAIPNGLVQASDGDLYGATFDGGQYECGTFFKVTTAGAFTFLTSLPRVAGCNPAGPISQHTDGLFYGTTRGGGEFGSGTVYSLNDLFNPFVTFVLATGRPGQTAQILGQSLNGATSVTFNGVPADGFKVVSSTFVTAVVPSGATTGPVVVTTPGRNYTSNKNFTVSH